MFNIQPNPFTGTLCPVILSHYCREWIVCWLRLSPVMTSICLSFSVQVFACMCVSPSPFCVCTVVPFGFSCMHLPFCSLKLCVCAAVYSAFKRSFKVLGFWVQSAFVCRLKDCEFGLCLFSVGSYNYVTCGEAVSCTVHDDLLHTPTQCGGWTAR